MSCKLPELSNVPCIRIWQDIFSDAFESYSIPVGSTLDSWFALEDSEYCPDAIRAGRCTLPTTLINGQPLKPGEWFDRALMPGDQVRIYVEPEGLDIPLWVVYLAVAAVAVYTYTELSALNIPDSYNAQQDSSGTYNINAQGNRARLGAPATVPCGDFAFYPEFATEPWADYDDENNQWLYQIFGWAGPSEILDIQIGNTPISNHEDDIVAQYYLPGETVDLFATDVETSAEVGGNDGQAGITLPGFIYYNQDGNAIEIDNDDHMRAFQYIESYRYGDIWSRVSFPYPAGHLFYIEGSDTGSNTNSHIGVAFNGATIYGPDLDPADYRLGSSVKVTTTTGSTANDGDYRVGGIDDVLDGLILLNLDWTPASFATLAGLNVDLLNSEYVNGAYKVAENLPNKVVRVVQVDWEGTETSPTIPYYQDYVSLRSATLGAVGPFTAEYIANRSNTSVTRLQYDIAFPRGLVHYSSNGAPQDRSVTVEWHARNIGTGNIYVLEQTITANETTAYRKSFFHDLPESGTWAVSARRITDEDSSTRIQDEVQWTALKAVHSDSWAWPGFSILAMKIKATNALSSLAERKVRVWQQSIREVYDPVSETWSDQPTSSPAWLIASVLCNPVWGDGRDKSALDLDSLVAFDKDCAARGDRFRGLFDTRTDIRDALDRIAAVGRAKVELRNSKFRVVPDRPQWIALYQVGQPVIKAGSLGISASFDTMDSYDGVRAVFTDPTTWKDDQVELRLPGKTGNNLEEIRLYGVADRRQAVRNALYHCAVQEHRHTQLKFKTELSSRVYRYNDLLAVSHPLADWGQSGRVKSLQGLILTTTKPLEWEPGQTHYIALRGADGARSKLLQVTEGADEYQAVLAEDPGIDVVAIYDADGRIAADYQFGAGDTWWGRCLVRSAKLTGDYEMTVEVIEESDRVHQFDILESQLATWTDDNDSLELSSTPESGTEHLVYWQPITVELSGYVVAQGATSGFDPTVDYIDVGSCCHVVRDTDDGAWVKVAAYSAPDYDPEELSWVAVEIGA